MTLSPSASVGYGAPSMRPWPSPTSTSTFPPARSSASLGPDGANQSTLIRMLATVLTPDAGDAEVFGHSVTREAALVTPRIGYMSQRFSMYPDLSVSENLNFFATIRGVSRADRRTRSKALLESMGLAEFLIGRLSSCPVA